jgi:ketosteroid isomerase-like protein
MTMEAKLEHWPTERRIMEPIREPITGNEEQGHLSLPYQALVQFYFAFNHADMPTMQKNWAITQEISMDNPLGGIKRGWEEIKSVYERIFNGPAEVNVVYHDYTIHESQEMFYTVGRELGYFRLGSNEVKLAIRTSRIFQKIDGHWRQVHHHGSIDDPQLLGRYQTAVLGKRS